MIRQASAKKPWAVVLCLSGINILHKIETVQNMVSIPVIAELKIQEVATLMCDNGFQVVDEVVAAAAAGISHGTFQRTL
jgi:hypothetical protein